MCRLIKRSIASNCFNFNIKIVRDEFFPENPKKSIIRSIYKFEKMFIEKNFNE